MIQCKVLYLKTTSTQFLLYVQTVMFSKSRAAESQNMQTVLLFSRTRKKHPEKEKESKLKYNSFYNFFLKFYT